MKKAFTIILSLMFIFAVSTVTFAADPAKPATPAKAEEKKAAPAKAEVKDRQVTGEVTAIDAKAKTITVKKDKEETKVTTTDKTKVMAGKDAKTLADIKVGTKVTVFFKTDDKNTCNKIEIKAEEKKAAAPAKAEEKKAAPAPAPKAEEKKAAPAKKSGGY